MEIATVPTEQELNDLLNKTFTTTFRQGYVTVNDFILPERYYEMEKDIKEFEVFDTDVWICGFPKTGTTWMSEIAWLILHNFDYEGAKIPDYNRTRMLEFSMLFNPKNETIFEGENIEVDSINHAKDQQCPRTIKSHFPYSLLPQQISSGAKHPKIIYTARNPMDTCISYYYQCRNYEGFTGSLEDFCKLFLFDKVTYSPFATHVLSFWEQQKHNPNILFLTYEEIKKDLPRVIQRVAQLLGKTVTEEKSKKLQEHVSFDTMKNNPAVNKQSVNERLVASAGVKIEPFIRAGKAGGYKSVMSSELINQFRYWMEKRFKNSGFDIFSE